MGLLSGVGGVGGVVECWGVGWVGFLSGWVGLLNGWVGFLSEWVGGIVECGC